MFRTISFAVGVGISVCALALVFQLSCTKNKEKEAIEAKIIAPELPVNDASDKEAGLSQKTESVPPEIEALNAIQRELADLSNEDLAKEEIKLNAHMRENDLIDRLNKNVATDQEKEFGKKVLIRLALIRVEKSKRETRNKKAANNDSSGS